MYAFGTSQGKKTLQHYIKKWTVFDAPLRELLVLGACTINKMKRATLYVGFAICFDSTK